ncbi:MAG: hypothetical protein WC341_17900 [Bacteroidales bacterium]|jgi:hypothetical protein
MAQTNNSYLADKVALRINHLPDGNLKVLECYGGEGKIWKAVRKITGRKIITLSIEIENDNDDLGFYLPGDNRAYLETLDLKKFDVIDLDAYGVPFDQMEQVFKSGYHGVVFVTFIQSVMGMMPVGLLHAIGFKEEMIKKCPTLFWKLGWKYFQEYLSLRGVTKIWHRSHARKHYICFEI